jgi:hypothetical protein
VIDAAGEFFCRRCQGFFDGIEEGGTHFNDPTKRIELEDERRAAKVRKLGGRRK